MLVLFETSAGFAVFKLLDEKRLQKVDNLFQDFATPEKACQLIQLKCFEKFNGSTEALQAALALNDGKVCKPLKKILKKVYAEEANEQLVVWDAKLGNAIKEKLSINCVSGNHVAEFFRCLKSQAHSFLPGLQESELAAMSLGLAHNLARYKMKFSPDKVDTMIVQAVNLLDDIDKELNNYIMRAREWYGWHFPELGKILVDNYKYIKTVIQMGTRDNAVDKDFDGILSEEESKRVKEAAEMSMGTEITLDDIFNIHSLCTQVIDLMDYKEELSQYLNNRMHAIAPNLSIMVGEVVGARLISHAGSLINLAKHPASTIQILGAEKALFRALKTRSSTPKYGIIYHAQMVNDTSMKNKGKMSRMLAAKTALACRYDAMGEESSLDLGTNNRAKLAARIKMVEDGVVFSISGRGKGAKRFDNYRRKDAGDTQYNEHSDFVQSSKKRSFDDSEEQTDSHPKRKKQKLLIEEVPIEQAMEVESSIKPESADISTKSEKKKKKHKEANESLTEGGETSEAPKTPKSEKKKKHKETNESLTEEGETSEAPKTPKSEKKKKKQKDANETTTEEVEATETPKSEKKEKKKKKKKVEDD